VLASFGHVRDLPAKDGSVRPDEDFAMSWSVDTASNKRLNEIATAMKSADSLILATDPDREGEAISWHVLEVLNKKKAIKDKPVRRVVFNAITKKAVSEAMANPRDIDTPLVDAYLARRALDYLVGFTLSPVLWRKLPGARSAGRVQSVALRLVCDRESEIERFKPEEYWQIAAHLKTEGGQPFVARLTGFDGKRITKMDIDGRRPCRHDQDDAGAGVVHGRIARSQTAEAQSGAAVHHLDAAAGSLRQARLRAGAHHAGGAAALRGHRCRRRDRRPDHLYAYRRRADGAGGDHRRARRDRQGIRRQLRAGPAATIRPRPRTRRKRTRRSARPTSCARPPRCAARSMPTR
jgi:hypothetical protein